ncbi:hypothetical protein HHS34_005530 [Acidithiobacillus montserratensis]|uniref:Uncharacterized protein n=1 Tax=Acidithiobacillus montserratensis TaxID=2729135 RepID=A0ACD5HIQ7_9PROT|nr:hypothetical protein [Acidithiobacillus montserratensis]MBU2747861.1 hypothetical protein [Acidithiobacillus montserratensis]
MEPGNTIIIQAQPKSMAAGLILTFLFGPLGLFYASVTGGIVLLVVGIIFGIIAVFTFGLGAILLPLVWVASMIWAAVAVDKINKAAMQALQR